MHICSVVSARPNFIKLAAICRAIDRRPEAAIRHTIIHTGQHYDPLLSDIFFKQLTIPTPTINLEIGGLSRVDMIAKTHDALLTVFSSLKPDWVFVYGDVNGAVGAAGAAHECSIPIAHIEAGLRSFDQEMPEELNRIAIDGMARLLFCTERSAVENVIREQRSGTPVLVGNTMADTLLSTLPFIRSRTPSFSPHQPFVLSTLHRPSNVDHEEPLGHALRLLTRVNEHCRVYIAAHPRLMRSLASSNALMALASECQIIEPLGYLEFLSALDRCEFILTDSGGIQEEAVVLHKRCFTLRRNTERPVTVESGSNVLVDPSRREDCESVMQYVTSRTPAHIEVPKEWDGKTGDRIIDYICRQ